MYICSTFSSCRLLVPTRLGGADNIGGNVGDVFIGETSSESRHGVLSVGDLDHNGLLTASSSKVRIESLLLEGLLGHDDVLSSGVACRAVLVENRLSGTNITGECRGNGNGSGGSLLGGEGESRGGGGEDGGNGELHFWSVCC